MDELKIGFKIFVPAFLAFFVSNVANSIASWGIKQKIIFGAISNLIFIMIFVLCWQIYNGYVCSIIELWKTGQIKGLWKGRGLSRQVTKAFARANEIKIKVTRGSELLKVDNIYSIKSVLDKVYVKCREEQKQMRIKILLIEPCFQLKHVQERYQRHKKNMRRSEFIETWYDFLYELHRAYPSNEYFSYEVRFYSGRHSKWRFYICNTQEKNITTVLLSNYDVNTSGSSTPMYKIIKGDLNIGGFMDRYYEEVWEESLQEEELIKHILNGTCKRYFCEICFTCGYEEECSRCEQCQQESDCKRIVREYVEKRNRKSLNIHEI